MLLDLLKNVFGVSNLDKDTECFVSIDGSIQVALPGYCDEDYLDESIAEGKYMSIKELEDALTVYFENEYGDHECSISAQCLELVDYGVASFYAVSSNCGYEKSSLKYNDWNSMI